MENTACILQIIKLDKYLGISNNLIGNSEPSFFWIEKKEMERKLLNQLMKQVMKEKNKR